LAVIVCRRVGARGQGVAGALLDAAIDYAVIMVRRLRGLSG
jgi:hypothetical protein